jgi:hypothetical protein
MLKFKFHVKKGRREYYWESWIYKHWDNQLQERKVVSFAYAVVQPDAMVIEPSGAPLAPPTMLRIFQNVSWANMAVKFIIIFWELLLRQFHISLFPYCAICRIRFSCDHSVIKHDPIYNDVDDAPRSESVLLLFIQIHFDSDLDSYEQMYEYIESKDDPCNELMDRKGSFESMDLLLVQNYSFLILRYFQHIIDTFDFKTILFRRLIV